MTIHLVTFSDESMSRSAELCVSSAQKQGVNSRPIVWAPELLRDTDHQSVLLRSPDDPSRAVGHWSWKPHIIREQMRLTDPGDVLIYSDAGVEFINHVSHIIERMDQDIFLFGNNWEHAHWCKRDTMEAVWPWWNRGRNLNMDAERVVNVFAGSDPRQREINTRELAWERFGKQVQASVIFLRVSDYTRKFVKEWLDWCIFEGGRLIDDSPSRLPNHPEFREHRHDQAILTTMAYREGIKLHYWPAVYNKGGTPEFLYEQLPEYAGDTYPCLFSHHRRRDHEWAIAV